MSVPAEQLKFSPEAYLEGEKVSEIRHEYIDGEIYAMAGGSDAHAKISGNAFALIKAHLRGSGCSTYIADMKAQADDTKFCYPDVMVTCDKDDAKSNYVKYSPKLIIEVLSPGTEAYDRGKKFAYYRQIEALQEYVLIYQFDYQVEVFRKNDQQRWELFFFSGKDAIVDLQSVEWSGAIEDLYEDVDFELACQEKPSDPDPDRRSS